MDHCSRLHPECCKDSVVQAVSGDEANGGPSSNDKPVQNSAAGSQQLAPRHKKVTGLVHLLRVWVGNCDNG